MNPNPVAERYAKFREAVAPELARRRQPDWDDNYSHVNRGRAVPRQKREWRNKKSPGSNGASTETDATTD